MEGVEKKEASGKKGGSHLKEEPKDSSKVEVFARTVEPR